MYSEYRTFVVSVWFYGIYLTFSNLLANSGEQALLWDEIQGKYNDQSGENPALSRCLKTLTIGVNNGARMHISGVGPLISN